jgi:hypothetical protein
MEQTQAFGSHPCSSFVELRSKQPKAELHKDNNNGAIRTHKIVLRFRLGEKDQHVDKKTPLKVSEEGPSVPTNTRAVMRESVFQAPTAATTRANMAGASSHGSSNDSSTTTTFFIIPKQNSSLSSATPTRDSWRKLKRQQKSDGFL